MDNKMNILVIGKSRSGKTTLINSIAGINAEKGYTDKIKVYESDEIPIRCIDTKGIEDNIFETFKSIYQINRYSKKGIKDKNKEIHAIWYCIEPASKETQEKNIKQINTILKKWKNIPIYIVITKSYYEENDKKNIAQLEEILINYKKLNIKKIIPIVSKEYIDNEVIIAPKGIEELCLETLNSFDEAQLISKENIIKFTLIQKRVNAQGLILSATGIAIGIAFVDRKNKVDSLLLVPLEKNLTILLFKIYGVKYSKELVDDVLGSGAITSVAKHIVGKFDRTQIIDAAVAGTIVFTIGEAVVYASEKAFKGEIELDNINEYIIKFIKNAPTVGVVIDYLNKNKDELKDKNPQEVVKELKELFKENSKKRK